MSGSLNTGAECSYFNLRDTREWTKKQPRGTLPSEVNSGTGTEGRMTANQVVAYNLRVARTYRGLNQEEAAERLEPYLGTRWSRATFSNAERSIDGKRIKQFSADEIVAFSLAFELPIAWFFVPPEEDPWGRLPTISAPVEVPGRQLVAAEELLDRVVDLGDASMRFHSRLDEVAGSFRLRHAVLFGLKCWRAARELRRSDHVRAIPARPEVQPDLDRLIEQGRQMSDEEFSQALRTYGEALQASTSVDHELVRDYAVERLLEVLPDHDDATVRRLLELREKLPQASFEIVREQILEGAGLLQGPTGYAISELERQNVAEQEQEGGQQ